MKPLSFKMKIGLIGLFIFIMYEYADAEWRRLGEFPKGDDP